MPNGVVKFFNADKGFGFIQQESGDDLFFHHSEVSGGDLSEGEAVAFDIGQGQKGPCATKVSRA